MRNKREIFTLLFMGVVCRMYETDPNFKWVKIFKLIIKACINRQYLLLLLV